MKGVINRLKLTSVSALTRLMINALDTARLQLETRADKTADNLLPPLRDESPAIAERFMQHMNGYFDSLITHQVRVPSLSVYDSEPPTDGDHKDAVIAMEGMVKHARNCHVQESISLITRMSAISPNLRIDETNNPLDPEQIGESFNEAIRPLKLQPHHLLTIYREFNKAVFHHLEEVLIGANDILIDVGILPKLDIQARTREQQKSKRALERPTTDRETRAFDAEATTTSTEPEAPDPERFTLLQELVAAQTRAPDGEPGLLVARGTNAAGAEAEPEAQLTQLQTLLTHLQLTLEETLPAPSPEESAASLHASITDSLRADLSRHADAGHLSSLCPAHADVINLITLLYEGICQDATLPEPMKALLARTQLPILRVALADTSFFREGQHPARLILNEFALAGIAWTEPQGLGSDAAYLKVRELVNRLLEADTITAPFLQGLVDELRIFTQRQRKVDSNLELRIREADDYAERLEDIAVFAQQKIRERILTETLDPFIQMLLDTYFHPFLVKLILKEGPGGSSWKPVMSTIDVLLWSVHPAKQAGDRDRFEKINARLLDNLAKALKIGGASPSRITKTMRQLRSVQNFSFHTADGGSANVADVADTESTEADSLVASTSVKRTRQEPPPLPRDDPHLRQVGKLPIGIWLEFHGASSQPVRCTLAARIDSIDKLFFVNHAGVKVVELTHMQLARELKAGTVRIVSEGALTERALEWVVSYLRGAVSAI